MGIAAVDEKEGYVYFMASPDNATQAYLYRTRLDGKRKPDLVSPTNQVGTHNYEISPNQKYARHIFPNYYTFPIFEWITLADHKALDNMNSVNDLLHRKNKSKSNIEFFKIKTSGGVEMDAWKVMPEKFDSSKKYPVVFYVYSGPAAQTVLDFYGSTNNFVYSGDMARDGYIYISVDNRGTPHQKEQHGVKVFTGEWAAWIFQTRQQLPGKYSSGIMWIRAGSPFGDGATGGLPPGQ